MVHLLQPHQGTLLGVVLDLSGSMSESIKNKGRHQYSKIESFSRAFQQVLEDAKLFIGSTSSQEDGQLRLFITGFGLQTETTPTISDQIGDIFSILSSIDEQIKQYKSLQPEIEKVWLDTIGQILEDKRVKGNARQELRSFVAHELREQATQAEEQRSAARFQHWFGAVCQKLNAYDMRVRKRIEQGSQVAKILFLPFIIGFLWLLRGFTLFLAKVNQIFEAMIQKKLTELRNNADDYATRQAAKVAAITNKALREHLFAIDTVIENCITEFIDREAFRFIRHFKAGLPTTAREQAFDHLGLRMTYEAASKQIGDMMSPHANLAWKTSVFLLKQAAKALKIKPNWELLREKTTRCAQQIIWERIEPEVRRQAEFFVKERFIRAVLITIVQDTKNENTTLSPSEMFELVKQRDTLTVSMRELPLFSGSPLGTALNQTFIRLQKEKQLPQNKGLRPAILIVSDGMPTDANFIDASSLAENIKQSGIPIACCFVTKRNISHPWILRQRPGWMWPEAAHFMFSMASSIDEWPEFTQKLRQSRFSIKKNARLFTQLNHTEHIRNFMEAILLPIERERNHDQRGILMTND